jgi:hypothetical protein
MLVVYQGIESHGSYSAASVAARPRSPTPSEFAWTATAVGAHPHAQTPASSVPGLPPLAVTPSPPDTSDNWGLYPVSQAGFNRAQPAPTTPHTPHLFVIRIHAKHRPTPAPANSHISALNQKQAKAQSPDVRP